jgi:SHS2 domain-containing protein
MQSSKNMSHYEQIEHTGDIGIKIFGDSLKELMINAASAMFDVMLDIAEPKTNLAEEIVITGDNLDELLVNWLSELNYIFITEQKVFTKFDIARITNNEISATALGEKYDPHRHQIKLEIKAITYHEIYIKQVKEKWEAQVIFDI